MSASPTEPRANSQEGDSSRWAFAPVTPAQRGFWIFGFFSLALLLTGLVSAVFADLLWRTGWSTSRTVALALFVPLLLFSVIGFLNAVYGFVRLRLGKEMAPPVSSQDLEPIDPGANTAIAFPVCNEPISRVFEGLRATYESLQSTGQLDRFDFFVLSDTSVPERWIEEEREWQKLIQSLGALGRIYYRRRLDNEGRKSGNIREFLKSWGRRYRYFLIMDADSVMRGETLVSLVRMMEANRSVGLIQTVPASVNAASLFGRMNQFANRFYTRIFVQGLTSWSEGLSNYWGHNAIIRVEPFMRYCALPQLPGRKPFGGHILSHDFVEAALLLKENWQVYLACQLPGSYEEAPETMIENAKRDRRWCQGNLQHSMLFFARGLHGISRLHLAQGIFGYLASPLWLAFLLVFYWMWLARSLTGLSRIAVHSRVFYLNLDASHHALLVFLLSMGILLTPRLLAIIDAALDPSRLRAFGGSLRMAASVILETIFSTLHAPLQMLWHTRFVVSILLGQGVDWGAPKEAADGTAWSEAWRQQWWQTALGVISGVLIWRFAHAMFWWFTPVLCGMALAVPISAVTSRKSWGAAARRMGLFLTPEETSPPPELAALLAGQSAPDPESSAESEAAPATPILDESVVDPYLNAIHVSLLRETKLQPEAAAALAKMGMDGFKVRLTAEKLLRKGFGALPVPERVLVLSDADTMSWLHRQVWRRPEVNLAPAWRTAIRNYCS